MSARFQSYLETLRSHGSQVCLQSEGASWTYSQLLQELGDWQRRLDESGIARGDVVGVRADYCFAAVSALLALFERRTVVALIPRDRESGRYLEDARAQAFLDFDAQGGCQFHRLPAPLPHPLTERLREQNQAGVIIFTSGSTARPKATLQSVERFLYKIDKPRRPMRTLAFMIFDHVAGLDGLLYTLLGGGTLILAPRRDPQSVMKLIQAHRVELLPTSPSFLRLLCATDEHFGFDLSSLKVISYGSEPMDMSTLARLNARLPNARLVQAYGTTETGTPRSVSRSGDSLWLKMKEGIETRIVEDMLWIRGEATILGYLNAPSPVDEQGWYCTGDLVESDGEWIRFRGRSVDVISVGGEKVAPAEIEQSILELDFVRDTIVAGEAHPLMGQVVTARVALSTAMDPKEAAGQIRLHCRQRLAAYKVPVRIDITTESFTNARQKAQRRRMD